MSETSKRLADFFKSADGQSKLKQFFIDARAEFQKWEPALRSIPGILSNIMNAISGWAGVISPFLNTVGPILKEHPGLVTAIFTAYMSWRSIVPVISGI